MKLIILLLLILSGCSAHRIGGAFLYEYGNEAVSNSATVKADRAIINEGENE